MSRVAILFISLFFISFAKADTLKCDKKDYRIVCTYFSSRSDGMKDVVLRFRWISPKTPLDDRVRDITMPPYYGSAYDYRFIPGRVPGHWRVEVTDIDKNKTLKTTFDLNETEDEFFKN